MSNRNLRSCGRTVVVGFWLNVLVSQPAVADEPPPKAVSTAATPSPPPTPSAAVRQRIDAFNRHDLNAYLKVHHPTVKIYRYPNHLLGTGHAHLRRIFGPSMQNKDGRLETAGQFVVDDMVVSNEFLTLAGRREHYVAIYRVVDGKVATIRLIEHRRERR